MEMRASSSGVIRPSTLAMRRKGGEVMEANGESGMRNGEWQMIIVSAGNKREQTRDAQEKKRLAQRRSVAGGGGGSGDARVEDGDDRKGVAVVVEHAAAGDAAFGNGRFPPEDAFAAIVGRVADDLVYFLEELF